MTQQPQLTPEQDIELAHAAVAKNDLPHALHHLAWALQTNPQNAAALSLLDSIIADSPDASVHIPLKPTMSTAESAVHAYIRAQQDNYDVALQIIGQVNKLLPDGRFLGWASDWIARPAAQSTPLRTVMTMVVEMAQAHPGNAIPDLVLRERVARFVDALESYAQATDDAMFNVTYALLLRKAGRFEKSLARAQAAYDALPNVHALIAKAYALQALEQIEDSLVTFQQALELDPSFVEVHNDMGDMLISLGRTSEAALAYGKVLDKYPDNQWAAPSYYFYQFQLDSDPYWKTKLLTFAAKHPDNQRANELVRALSPDGMAFIDYLPEPSEAIINVTKQVLTQGAEVKGDFNIGLSALEAPSAVMAITRAVAPDARPIIEVSQVQRPDPRKPLNQSPYKLWTYTDTDAAPALPQPPQHIADAIAQIASKAFSREAWAKEGQALAEKLGEKEVEALLSVMVHPPAAPADMSEWRWIQNVQVAAALTIAHLSKDWERPIPKKGFFGKSSEPTPRKKVLHALLFGVMDWTTTAAIIALSHIASTEPQHEREIAKWFSDVYYQMPKGGYVPYSYALGTCGLRLPSLSSLVKQKFHEMANVQ